MLQSEDSPRSRSKDKSSRERSQEKDSGEKRDRKDRKRVSFKACSFELDVVSCKSIIYQFYKNQKCSLSNNRLAFKNLHSGTRRCAGGCGGILVLSRVEADEEGGPRQGQRPPERSLQGGGERRQEELLQGQQLFLLREVLVEEEVNLWPRTFS